MITRSEENMIEYVRTFNESAKPRVLERARVEPYNNLWNYLTDRPKDEISEEESSSIVREVAALKAQIANLANIIKRKIWTRLNEYEDRLAKLEAAQTKHAEETETSKEESENESDSDENMEEEGEEAMDGSAEDTEVVEQEGDALWKEKFGAINNERQEEGKGTETGDDHQTTVQEKNSQESNGDKE